MTTFKMPMTSAWIVTFENGDIEFHDEYTSLGETQEPLYTAQALRDVLEQVASFCEQNQIAIGRGSRTFTEFEKECGGVHAGMDYAKAIRAMIKEIPE